MNSEYLSCADTAKLLRAALRESFPAVKFSVRSSVYSGGASIDISWTDGPTSKQVEAISCRFEGAYFDGMIDYKGSRYHTLDGSPVHFGANFIFERREYSDALLARAIADVSQGFGGNTPITVDGYKRGDAHSWRNDGGCDLGRALRLWFSGEAQIDSVTPDAGMIAQPSATLARVRFAGDDGYGQGTVGRNPAQPDGEQCYKAQEAARQRVADARALGLT